jgi:hypothetical protein
MIRLTRAGRDYLEAQDLPRLGGLDKMTGLAWRTSLSGSATVLSCLERRKSIPVFAGLLA